MADKKTTKKPAKPAKAEEPETVGGVPVDAPDKEDWEASNNPSPAEQQAQRDAFDKELEAQNS